MADNGNKTVAAAVRAELARAKISGRQLACDLDISYRVMKTRLSGEYDFRADELARIAAHLGVPIQRLYGPADQPVAPTAVAS